MNFLKLFKKKEKATQVRIQQANVTLYSDQILVATEDQTEVGYSITTPNVTKLPVDATPESIGQTVRKHLSLSKSDVPVPTDFKVMYQDFLNAAGFKNAKEHHKGARYMSIYQKDQTISITLTINGGATGREKGYLGIPDMPSIEMDASISDIALGEKIKEAWMKCSDNSV